MNDSPTKRRERLLSALYTSVMMGTVRSDEPLFRLIATGRFPIERFDLKDLKSDDIKDDNWHLRK